MGGGGAGGGGAGTTSGVGGTGRDVGAGVSGVGIGVGAGVGRGVGIGVGTGEGVGVRGWRTRATLDFSAGDGVAVGRATCPLQAAVAMSSIIAMAYRKPCGRPDFIGVRASPRAVPLRVDSQLPAVTLR